MAQEEHVQLVKKGFLAVRSWREANKQDPLDLSGADLRGCDLSGMNFSGAHPDEPPLWQVKDYLARSYLYNLILRRAALFMGAKLTGAKFRGAVLIGADFSDADLSGADLTNAICSTWEGFICADFSRANLSDLVYPEGDLDDSDHPYLELACSRGLETAKGTFVRQYIES